MNRQKIIIVWGSLLLALFVLLLVGAIYVLNHLWWWVSSPDNQQAVQSLIGTQSLTQKVDLLEQQVGQLDVRWLMALVSQVQQTVSSTGWSFTVSWQDAQQSLVMMQSLVDQLWSGQWLSSWQREQLGRIVEQLNRVVE